MLRWCWLLLMSGAVWADNVLVMGYPEREKEPFIAEQPDNRGLYHDLFSTAARHLGYRLEVRRASKRRVFEEMSEGTIDFYPGSLTADRVGVMNWMMNGLIAREVCVTRMSVGELSDLASAPPMRVLTEQGASKATIDQRFPQLTPVIFGPKVSLEQALKLMQAGRGELFIIEEAAYRAYLKSHHLKSLASRGARVHLRCLEAPYPMLIGFSRHSRYYAEMPNPTYRADEAISLDNLPYRVDPHSVAGRFAAELMRMKHSGETARIAAHYLGSE
ncbi:hypothetical protein ACTSKR_06245 [Chitinibacteraceae bacterium HSL-7]